MFLCSIINIKGYAFTSGSFNWFAHMMDCFNMYTDTLKEYNMWNMQYELLQRRSNNWFHTRCNILPCIKLKKVITVQDRMRGKYYLLTVSLHLLLQRLFIRHI